MSSRALMAALFLSLLAPTVASAQEPEDEYASLITDAVGEQNAGHYPEAVALFERAHAMRPSARTLRGLGLAAFEMRDYVRCIEALEAALEHPERPLEGEMRAEVERFIDRARGFTTLLVVRVTPADADVTVQGQPVELDERGAVRVNAGVVEIVATADGYRSERRTPTARAGQEHVLELVLATLVVDEPVDAAPVAGASSRAGSMDDGDDSDAIPLVLLTASAVALAGFGASLAWMLKVRSDVDECVGALASEHLHCDNAGKLDVSLTMWEVATVGFGVAAVGLGVAWLLASGSDDSHAEAEVSCAASPLGLGCRGRF